MTFLEARHRRRCNVGKPAPVRFSGWDASLVVVEQRRSPHQHHETKDRGGVGRTESVKKLHVALPRSYCFFLTFDQRSEARATALKYLAPFPYTSAQACRVPNDRFRSPKGVFDARSRLFGAMHSVLTRGSALRGQNKTGDKTQPGPQRTPVSLPSPAKAGAGTEIRPFVLRSALSGAVHCPERCAPPALFDQRARATERRTPQCSSLQRPSARFCGVGCRPVKLTIWQLSPTT